MLNKIIEKIDSLINPIIVKELRQMVRGKFFWANLILFLLFQCGVLSLSLADNRNFQYSNGAETLTFLFGILFLVCYAIIPLNAGFRFARERTGRGDELLYITTITPHSIIQGKFLATMAVISLIVSSFAPFMGITFFLSGVDLPLTFFALAIGILICASATMLQICLGSLARDSNAFNVFRGLGIFFTVSTFFGVMGAISDTLRYGASRTFGTSHFYVSVAVFVFFVGLGNYFLYLASAAVISPSGVNRMYPVRRFLTLSWIVSFLVCVFYSNYAHAREVVAAWGYLYLMIFSAYYFVAVSEREKLSLRVAKELPEGRIKRIWAFLFFSGSAGGIAWALLMQILTIVAVFGGELSGVFAKFLYSSWAEEFLKFALSVMLYGLAYNLIASFIQRHFLRDYISIRSTWVISLIIGAIFCISPIFLGFFFGFRDEYFVLGSPLSMASRKLWPVGVVIASISSFLALTINFPWLFGQYKEIQAFVSPIARKEMDNE